MQGDYFVRQTNFLSISGLTSVQKQYVSEWILLGCRIWTIQKVKFKKQFSPALNKFEFFIFCSKRGGGGCKKVLGNVPLSVKIHNQNCAKFIKKNQLGFVLVTFYLIPFLLWGWGDSGSAKYKKFKNGGISTHLNLIHICIVTKF